MTDAGRVRGFTLLEVVVAVTVLVVGLVGVAGLTVVAVRELERARSAGWATAAVSEVADSLARHGVGGGGVRALPGGAVRWSAAEGPAPDLVEVELEARAPDGRRTLRARALLPASTERETPP